MRFSVHQKEHFQAVTTNGIKRHFRKKKMISKMSEEDRGVELLGVGPPPKRPRRAHRLSEEVRQAEHEAVVDKATEKKMQAFTTAKAAANCCSKTCIIHIPDDFAIESIRCFRSLPFESRSAILHGVKCVTNASANQRMYLRGLKKHVCLECFLKTLGVSKRTWKRVKDESGWHLGNVEVVEHASKHRERPFNFVQLGGVKLTTRSSA